jgi:hypothetical protein
MLIRSQNAKYARASQEDDERAPKKPRSDRSKDEAEVRHSNPALNCGTNSVKQYAQIFLEVELNRRKNSGLGPLNDSAKKMFRNKARESIEEIDLGNALRNIKNIKSIKAVFVPEKKAEIELYDEILTHSTFLTPRQLENVVKQNSDLQKTIADMEERHRERLIEMNREITSTYLQPRLEKQKKQDSSAKYNLTVKLDGEKKARHVVEKRLQEEVETLKSNHKTAVAELAAMYTKKLEDTWKAREDKEKRKTEHEAAKLRDKQEKLEQFKFAKHAKLEARAMELNSGIMHLINRKQDGTIALTKGTEILPKQVCLDGLTDLWRSHGTIISSILPHRLMNDLDSALEFEVDVIIAARVYMLNLQLWGFEPQELLGTGWSSIAINRFKNGLYPYHSDTELSTMSVAVREIHQTLQQAVTDMHGGQVPVANYEQQFAPLDYNNNATISQGLFIQSPYAPVQSSFTPMQPTFAPQIPTLTITQATPPMPYMETKASQAWQAVVPMNQNPSAEQQVYVPDAVYQPPSVTQRFGQAPTSAQPAVEKPEKVCFNMDRDGFCRFGDNCKFSHNVARTQITLQLQPPPQNGAAPAEDISMSDLPADACVNKRAIMPCNNIDRFSVCRKASCPYMHPPGTHIGAAPPNTIQDTTLKLNQPLIFGAKPAGKPARPCRNEQNGGRCMMNSCIFSHQFPHGANNEIMMSDAGEATVEGNVVGCNANAVPRIGKECFNERDNGVCNRPNCKFVHEFSHFGANNVYASSNAGSEAYQGSRQASNAGPIPKACRFEAQNGHCTNAKCRFAHMSPPGAPMLDDGYDADEGTPPPKVDKQCRAETNNGQCTRKNCKFAHQIPHGSAGNDEYAGFKGSAFAKRTTWEDGRLNPFAIPIGPSNNDLVARTNFPDGRTNVFAPPIGPRSAPSTIGYIDPSLQERITRGNAPHPAHRNRFGADIVPPSKNNLAPSTGPRHNRSESLQSRFSPPSGRLRKASQDALDAKLGQGGGNGHGGYGKNNRGRGGRGRGGRGHRGGRGRGGAWWQV